jgi:D-glycerate 3-kinase
MKVAEECFNKVKKDCFKFIKSQETSNEKFGNKNGMLKSFLIPMCFWIAKKANNKKPYFVGLAGGQGNWQNDHQFNYKDHIRKVF